MTRVSTRSAARNQIRTSNSIDRPSIVSRNPKNDLVAALYPERVAQACRVIADAGTPDGGAAWYDLGQLTWRELYAPDRVMEAVGALAAAILGYSNGGGVVAIVPNPHSDLLSLSWFRAKAPSVLDAQIDVPMVDVGLLDVYEAAIEVDPRPVADVALDVVRINKPKNGLREARQLVVAHAASVLSSRRRAVGVTMQTATRSGSLDLMRQTAVVQVPSC